MAHCVRFKIDKLPPSLNTMLRTHWRDRAKEQETWDHYMLAEWLNQQRFIFLKPVKIKYTLSFDVNRKRDFDNYYGGTKYITDALKRTFLLKDDSQWIRDVEVEFVIGEPATIVEIYELEEAVK